MPLAPVPLEILKDLLISQSTADSIAGRLDLPTEQITILLRQQLAAGHVESFPVQCLIVWRITYDGRTQALLNL